MAGTKRVLENVEIIDEAGNIHGPFATMEDVDKCVDSRALGEQRDNDDTIGRGWQLRIAKLAA